jgi:hypothetical protein
LNLLVGFLSLSLLVSLLGNLGLFLRHKWQDKNRRESVELLDFLHDLTSGTGLIKVERLAPADVLLRSPRGRG